MRSIASEEDKSANSVKELEISVGSSIPVVLVVDLVK
jgi:hypothetical protein